MLYCTRLEAQNVDKHLTFAWFWDGRFREAKSFVFYVSGRLWERVREVSLGASLVHIFAWLMWRHSLPPSVDHIVCCMMSTIHVI